MEQGARLVHSEGLGCVVTVVCWGHGMGVRSPMTLARSIGFEGIPDAPTCLCEHGQLPPCRVSYVLSLTEEIEHVGFPFQVTVADTYFLFLA